MHKNFMTKETSPLLKKVVDLSNLISTTIMEVLLFFFFFLVSPPFSHEIEPKL